jgi:hypothetical protein
VRTSASLGANTCASVGKQYQRIEYIHNNPVEAGIVLQPEHYLHSSAMAYAGLSKGLIDVVLI